MPPRKSVVILFLDEDGRYDAREIKISTDIYLFASPILKGGIRNTLLGIVLFSVLLEVFPLGCESHSLLATLEDVFPFGR